MFRTALTGRCDARPELARRAACRWTIHVPALPCRGGADLAAPAVRAARLAVEAGRSPLDPAVPEWGDSRYVDVRLTGDVRLADALNHLYVLLPVLDDAKHYWVSNDEVDKLIRAGGGWLAGPPGEGADHPPLPGAPARADRARRWPGWPRSTTPSRRSSTTRSRAAVALDGPDRPVPLAEQRRGAVLAALRAAGARRVGDLGCGEGALVRGSARRTRDRAGRRRRRVARGRWRSPARRLRLERMTEQQRARSSCSSRR